MESQAKHTKGPWEYHAYYVTAGADRVAMCAPDNGEGATRTRDPEECKANTRLIAAAPSMLAALEKIGKFAESIDKDNPETVAFRAVFNEARKAIAKAKD